MPAKAKKAVPVKKKVTKSVKRSPAVSRKVRPQGGNVWNTQFMMKEQEDFYVNHPNSKILITVFIGALLLFIYIVWSNRVDIFPKLFVTY
jgi:hypothetical protein